MGQSRSQSFVPSPRTTSFPEASLVPWRGEKPWGDPALAACEHHLAMAIFVTPVGSSILLGSTMLPRADGAESIHWLAEQAGDTATLDGSGTP